MINPATSSRRSSDLHAWGAIGIGFVEVQVGQFVMRMHNLFMVGLLRQFQLLFRTAYKIGHFVRSDQRHDNLS